MAISGQVDASEQCAPSPIGPFGLGGDRRWAVVDPATGAPLSTKSQEPSFD
jgi:hypothetical protein